MKKLFFEHNRVVAVQPTGTGKSFLIFQLILDNPGKLFLIASPIINFRLTLKSIL
jgi:superfamily II DNA or RNA helicase